MPKRVRTPKSDVLVLADDTYTDKNTIKEETIKMEQSDVVETELISEEYDPFKPMKQKRSAPSTSDMRKLARRAGVVRIPAASAREAASIQREFLHKIVNDAVVHCECAGRKTITSGDVEEALKRNGRTIYGATN